MRRSAYKYTFDPDVQYREIEATLDLAICGTEALHGESAARLDARYFGDSIANVITIDASTGLGQDLNRLFANFVRLEFGEDAFRVKRVRRPSQAIRASLRDGT